jgi:hypothetical protein
MPYIDDWGTTSDARRAELMVACANRACGHARYRHGRAELQRGTGWKGPITLEAGACELCRCVRHFASELELPITRDDVIDTHDQLEFIERLSDIWTAEQWRQALTEEGS